ncbi:LacI family DNA-binding transcriptional regulator [Aestuariivirga sp.]|uniref:LacI family DNA-binding transcriptional regulator n=1 Tax=Aestuariivirga sp. TaxID=2650926 RepID=UPI0035948C14
MATMKDVARLAGVSIATVSSTLSGRNFVSPELKERVLAAIEELGYAPNAMASGLKRGTSSLIGLVVPDITNPFFTELVHHIQSRALENGFNVILGVSDNDAVREAELLRHMRTQQAAGSIVIPCGGEEDCRRLGQNGSGMPLVAADSAPLGMKLDTVVLDNRKAAGIATAHILSHGHERIAILVGPSHRFVSHERFLGFQAALEQRGVAFSESLAKRGNFQVDAAREAVLALLASRPRPTAIFVSNNLMMIGLLQAVAQAGLSVPKDISVVSIDDFPWATGVTPGLTTVRQPVKAIAISAFDCLAARIAGDEGEPRRIVLDPELVVRQSCAAPA